MLRGFLQKKKFVFVGLGVLILLLTFFFIAPDKARAGEVSGSCTGVVGNDGACYPLGSPINSSNCESAFGGSWNDRNSVCRISGMVVTVVEAGQLGSDSRSGVGVTPVQDPGVCGIPVFGKVMCGIAASLLMLPLGFASFLLFVAGSLLDFVLQYTVVSMSKNIGSVSGINIAWAVIRDLVNISFIFILLYSAINLIIGRGGDMKRVIVGVVMAAILVNFSLFFAKVIIDASNTVALTFYNTTIQSCDPGGKARLSACFSNPLGVSTIFSPTDNQQFLQDIDYNFLKVIVISLGGSIFLLITTFVFLAIAVMFIIRFITIIFLLILSPIMVMGSIIPKLSEHTNKWWKDMTEQAIFAPIFMVMIWVVLSILNSPGFITNNLSLVAGDQRLSALYEGDFPGSQALLLNFVVAIALIIGTLTISKSFSSKGGAMGGKFAGAVLGGGLGLAGRKTLGSFSRKVADSETLKAQAANEGGKYSRLQQMKAKAYLKTAQGGAKSSFDLRGANTGLSKTLGAGSATGKGGYDEAVKKKTEAYKKFGESLKPSDIIVEDAERELKAAESSGDPVRIAKAKAKLSNLKGNKKDVDAEIARLEEERKTVSNSRKAATSEATALKEAETKLESAKNAERSAEDTYRRLEIEADTAVGTARIEKIRQVVLAKNNLDAAKLETGDARRALESAKEVHNAVSANIDNETTRTYDGMKRAARDAEIKSAGEKRKAGYADAITNPGSSLNVLGYDLGVGVNRVGFVGPISRERRQAAIELRKTENKKDKLAKAVKEYTEEESPTPTTADPSTTQSATPPPATPTPPATP